MENKYHLSQRIIHWVMALIIIALLFMGYFMQDLPKPLRYEIYGVHKSFGVLVLMLFMARVALKIKFGAPALPKSFTKYEKIIANINHLALYGLMFLMPISGYFMSSAGGHPVKFFGYFLPALIEKNKAVGEFFHSMHSVIAIIFIITILLHLFGVIMHFVKKENILKRMI